jgi:hypothetical protein
VVGITKPFFPPSAATVVDMFRVCVDIIVDCRLNHDTDTVIISLTDLCEILGSLSSLAKVCVLCSDTVSVSVCRHCEGM